MNTERRTRIAKHRSKPSRLSCRKPGDVPPGWHPRHYPRATPERVETFMTRNGYTTRELAEVLGVSVSVVRDFRKNGAAPKSWSWLVESTRVDCAKRRLERCRANASTAEIKAVNDRIGYFLNELRG